jgi:photosystem II stability/assembly factor-like uncharacterized protein
MQGQMRAGDPPALKTIHMVDAQTGWAVTDPLYVSLLLRTSDGGTHWKDVTPLSSSGSKIRVIEVTVLSSLIAWVTGAGTFGSTTADLFRTIDGGRTWKSATIPALGVRSVSFINPRDGWLVASLGAGTGKHAVEIYRSTDGGESWIKMASATPDDVSNGLPFHGIKTAITFLNPTTGWIAGMFFAPGGFYLYVTHDGGRTWRHGNVPLARELTPHWRGFPQPPKFFTARDGILPVFYDILNNSGEDIGRVVVFYATHDEGTTWTHTALVRVNVSGLVYQAVADMHHAWVMNGGVLHATSDGARRWTIMPPNPLLADVTQLDFISPKKGWAVRNTALAGGTPKFPFLLKTMDGGRTWFPVTYTISRQ